MNSDKKPSKFHVLALPGDGIGPEVMEAALNVLECACNLENINLQISHGLVGGAAYDACSEHLPAQTLQLALEADAVLFGSVGGPVTEQHLPKWKGCEAAAILGLREGLKLSVNLRPVRIYPTLLDASPLKTVPASGVDLLIIRELLGDIYFGRHLLEKRSGSRFSEDSGSYTEEQIRRCAIQAFESARVRRKKLTSVDKANVLSMSKLWREVVSELAADYPDVQYEIMLVDNCAMQLVINPGQFDVIVTSNLFGDILSDLAAALPGSLGLIPSASLGVGLKGLYEPAGGSAPELAGQGVANPTAQILSAALLCRYSLGLENIAKRIENAVEEALRNYRTRDLTTTNALSTTEFSKKVIELLPLENQL